jgi:hypothetical protein
LGNVNKDKGNCDIDNTLGSHAAFLPVVESSSCVNILGASIMALEWQLLCRFATCQPRRAMSAVWGNPEDIC